MSEFNRRELLLKGSSAAAAAAAAYALRGPARTLLPGSARAATTTAWNHDPRSPIGPLHWAEIDPGFSVCGSGVQQSPVDIQTAHVGALHGPPLLLRYDASELAIENTGHVVEVPIPPGVEDVLQIGGDRYQLTQYHFHAPSEHTINGRHADVEGHFVHTNAAGDTAVVGVFFRIGRRPNPLLETILLNAPETSGEEGPPLGEANPAELFRGLEGARAKHGPGPCRLVLRLRRFAHDARLHRERALVGALRRWARLGRGRGALSRRDRAVRRLRRLPEQQPSGAAAQRAGRPAPLRPAAPPLSASRGEPHPRGTAPDGSARAGISGNERRAATAVCAGESGFSSGRSPPRNHGPRSAPALRGGCCVNRGVVRRGQVKLRPSWDDAELSWL